MKRNNTVRMTDVLHVTLTKKKIDLDLTHKGFNLLYSVQIFRVDM